MENKLRFTPGFFLLTALCLLILPVPWAAGAFLAAIVHESFHYMALVLCGGQAFGLSLTGSGAEMNTSALSQGGEAICALAGPFGSFLMVFLGEYFPEAAICGLIQGLYNLLPIFPLDGGRVLRCLFSGAVCRGIEGFALTLFSGLCFFVLQFAPEMGIYLMFFLWIPVLRRKFSCKERNLAVQ